MTEGQREAVVFFNRNRPEVLGRAKALERERARAFVEAPTRRGAGHESGGARQTPSGGSGISAAERAVVFSHYLKRKREGARSDGDAGVRRSVNGRRADEASRRSGGRGSKRSERAWWRSGGLSDECEDTIDSGGADSEA